MTDILTLCKVSKMTHNERILATENYLYNLERRDNDPDFNKLLNIAIIQFKLNKDLNKMINKSLRLLK